MPKEQTFENIVLNYYMGVNPETGKRIPKEKDNYHGLGKLRNLLEKELDYRREHKLEETEDTKRLDELFSTVTGMFSLMSFGRNWGAHAMEGLFGNVYMGEKKNFFLDEAHLTPDTRGELFHAMAELPKLIHQEIMRNPEISEKVKNSEAMQDFGLFVNDLQKAIPQVQPDLTAKEKAMNTVFARMVAGRGTGTNLPQKGMYPRKSMEDVLAILNAESREQYSYNRFCAMTDLLGMMDELTILDSFTKDPVAGVRDKLKSQDDRFKKLDDYLNANGHPTETDKDIARLINEMPNMLGQFIKDAAPAELKDTTEYSRVNGFLSRLNSTMEVAERAITPTYGTRKTYTQKDLKEELNAYPQKGVTFKSNELKEIVGQVNDYAWRLNAPNTMKRTAAFRERVAGQGKFVHADTERVLALAEKLCEEELCAAALRRPDHAAAQQGLLDRVDARMAEFAIRMERIEKARFRNTDAFKDFHEAFEAVAGRTAKNSDALYEQLKNLNTMAKAYMQAKNKENIDKQRSTDKGQARYDLAREITEFTDIVLDGLTQVKDLTPAVNREPCISQDKAEQLLKSATAELTTRNNLTDKTFARWQVASRAATSKGFRFSLTEESFEQKVQELAKTPEIQQTIREAAPVSGLRELDEKYHQLINPAPVQKAAGQKSKAPKEIKAPEVSEDALQLGGGLQK